MKKNICICFLYRLIILTQYFEYLNSDYFHEKSGNIAFGYAPFNLQNDFRSLRIFEIVYYTFISPFPLKEINSVLSLD